MTIQRANPTLEGQVAVTARRVDDLRNTALQRIAQKGGQIIDSVSQNVDVFTTATSFSSATVVLNSSPMQIYVSRAYYIYVPAISMFMNGEVNGIMGAQITYTLDGSAPNPNSTFLTESDIIVATQNFVSTTTLGATFFPVANATLRTQLAVWRVHTGGGSTQGGVGLAKVELTCFDMGTEV